MDQLYLLEVILDNLPDGVYVLDDRGNYIFVNSAYVQALNMPKDVLLHYNVHDFLNTGHNRHLCLGYRLPGEAPGGHVSGRAGHPKLWPGHHPPDDHFHPDFRRFRQNPEHSGGSPPPGQAEPALLPGHPGGVRLLHQRPAGFAAGKGLRRHR